MITREMITSYIYKIVKKQTMEEIETINSTVKLSKTEKKALLADRSLSTSDYIVIDFDTEVKRYGMKDETFLEHSTDITGMSESEARKAVK